MVAQTLTTLITYYIKIALKYVEPEEYYYPPFMWDGTPVCIRRSGLKWRTFECWR